MTKTTLTALYELNQRLNEENEILVGLRAAAHPGAQKLDGMPKTNQVNDKTSRLAIEIATVQERIDRLQAQIAPLEKDVRAYCATLKDSLLSIALLLRFCHAMPWKEVASCLGGYNTEVGVKSMCYRFLRQLE